MPKSMTHLNHHLVCATDCETTGLVAGYHEIIQACFLPLDEKLEPAKDLPIFDLYIKPEHPDRFDSPYTRAFDEAVVHGFDRYIAADLFDSWFKSLRLPEGKRIIMLGDNLSFERDFYRAWLGREHFEHFFDGRDRDLLTVACFMNDWADFNTDGEYPFPRNLKLKTIASRLGVEVSDNKLHDAVYDSDLAARCYRKTLRYFFSGSL